MPKYHLHILCSIISHDTTWHDVTSIIISIYYQYNVGWVHYLWWYHTLCCPILYFLTTFLLLHCTALYCPASSYFVTTNSSYYLTFISNFLSLLLLSNDLFHLFHNCSYHSYYFSNFFDHRSQYCHYCYYSFPSYYHFFF